MPYPILITYTILAVAVILLLTERLRADLVALLVALALGLSGVLDARETFAGFSRSAAITIIAVYILAEGLQRTGLTNQAGRMLVRLVGRKERWLAVASMGAAALLSLFMNNIAAASVILPVVSGSARRLKANPAKLMLPLAFGTILGGMATLLTTTNILVSGILREQGLEGFGLLDFLPVGLPLVLAGILYMSTIGYWMLPNTPPAQQQIHFDESQLMSIYRMEERLIQAKLPKSSALVGESLGHSNLRRKYNLNVVSIERSGRTILSPEPRTILMTGDILTMAGRVENIQDVETGLFDVLPNKAVKTDYLASENTTVIEALLTPRSSLIGQTLSGVHFRDKYKMNVLAIYRSGKPIRVSLTDLPLQFGDALLLQGPRQQIQVLQSEPDLILLYADVNASGLNQSKAPLALLIFLGTLLVSVFTSLSISEVMLAGGLLMVALGVISMDQAYQAVEWKTVFLVAGMLPLGTAMTKTGAANLAADGIVQLLGGYGPLILLGGLMVLSIALTQVMHGAVVGTIMAPIAIYLAQSLGLEARSFAMGIALATSFAFITPLGHPVNILVMSPGGYKFRDFIKIGLPLTILLVVLILILLPIFWPLTNGG